MVTLSTRSKFVEQHLNSDTYGRLLIHQFSELMLNAANTGRFKIHFKYDPKSLIGTKYVVTNTMFVEYLKIKKYKVYDEKQTGFKVLVA